MSTGSEDYAMVLFAALGNERFDPAPFNTPEHRAAQDACHHVIRCAVYGEYRALVVKNLHNERRNRGSAMSLMLAQLIGPCCLPPTKA